MNSIQMDVINSYQEVAEPKHLVYLAKPVYGGWVTFTSHLSLKYGYSLSKVTKNTEKTSRSFGYGCVYQNLSIQDIIGKPNVLITAVDKHYWPYLQYFPKGTGIVIHDPTECKVHKDGNPLVQQTDMYGTELLRDFTVYTIRKSVQDYLLKTFNISSTFLKHPFYAVPIPPHIKGLGFKHVSIARIDFDKHTDILLKANRLMSDTTDHIMLLGAENRLYVYHKLRDLDIETYWLGKFPKQIIPSYDDKSILKDAICMVDLSTIKHDGGGTQYTFLEAIHQDCILVLHQEWIDQGTTFTSGVNCIGVKDEHELATVLSQGIQPKDRQRILRKSKELLVDHLEVQW
jgi:hypothetical protein